MHPPQVVIFGASGDLTLRKLMPALASLAGKDRPTGGFSVVGVARSEKSDDAFRASSAAALPPELHAAFATLAPRVHYVQGDVAAAGGSGAPRRGSTGCRAGREAGGSTTCRSSPICSRATAGAGGTRGCSMRAGAAQPFRRVIVEKPFGHDLGSARALNHELHESLREDQIFRIDHYLGKETVQNLLGFRFHNAIFEPIWNRHHVEHIQITVAEELGMESGRAGYYDAPGRCATCCRTTCCRCWRWWRWSRRPRSRPSRCAARRSTCCARCTCPAWRRRAAPLGARALHGRGGRRQAVPGYLREKGVPAGSTTETYVAIRAEIDNWRWAGVPIFLRHGKRMPQKFTEVRVQFRVPPLQLFNRPEGIRSTTSSGEAARRQPVPDPPNVLTLAIQPREAIRLSFGVKRPGAAMVMAPAELSFDYREFFGADTAPAYERLLLDALQGDATLFVHADEIEASWRFADAYRRAWDSERGAAAGHVRGGHLGPGGAARAVPRLRGRLVAGDRAMALSRFVPSGRRRRRRQRRRGGAAALLAADMMRAGRSRLAIPGGSALAAMRAGAARGCPTRCAGACT
jgi:glucose-6-phosphate 1-dehydrogenase